MKIEYMQKMLISRLEELNGVYSSEFITEMKSNILNEGDIDKLRELDGFATDGVYLQYLKDNIQKKIGSPSLSILELKNYINFNRDGGDDVGLGVNLENNIPDRDGILNRVSGGVVYSGENTNKSSTSNKLGFGDDSIEFEDDDSEDDGIEIDYSSDEEDDGIEFEDDDSDEDGISIEEDDDDEIDIEEEDDGYDEDGNDGIDIEEEDDDSEEDGDSEYSTDDEDDDSDDEIDIEEDDDFDEDEDDDSDDIDIDLEEDEDDLDEYGDSDEDESDEEDGSDIDIDLDDDDDLDEDDYLEDDDFDEDSIEIDEEDDDGLDDSDDYLDSLLGNNSSKDDDLDEEVNNIVRGNSTRNNSSQNSDKPANSHKEKVFNNDFSNNTWDILNGAIDGVSKILRKL